MTELEWLSAKDPRPMLAFVADRVSERKFRLFSVACCRRIGRMLVHESSRKCVEVAERYCYGEATLTELRAAAEFANQDPEQRWGGPCEWWAGAWAAYAAEMTCFVVEPGEETPSYWAQEVAEEVIRAIADDREYIGPPYGSSPGHPNPSDWAALCPLVREIVGNPFHQLRWEAAWRTETVRRLAEGILRARAFDHLPILGDALEEAGYSDETILEHCRKESEHLPGCWVVDLALALE